MESEKISPLNLCQKKRYDKITMDVKKAYKPKYKMGKKRNATLRKDGRWQSYIKINGKRKACYGATEYLANYNADVEEAKANQDEEALEKLTGVERFLFSNAFYRYRNYMLFYTSVTPETVDRYENTFDKYFPNSSLANMDVRKINSTDISNFFINIMKKYERLTTREWQRIKHIIKATIGFVYDEELDDEDIANIINWDKIKKRASTQGKIYKNHKQQYAISVPEKEKLKEKVLKENIYPEKFAQVLMIIINFSLGLRIGELAALKDTDIDMQRHVVYVNESFKSYKKRDEFGNPIGGYEHIVGVTKTPRGRRIIPMSHTVQSLFTILLEYRNQMGYTSPFLAYDGDNIKARTKYMAHVLRRLCEKTNIDDFTSHIIRKSFATALSCCPDIDIATISEYLGHAQVSTTVNNYLIPARETLENRIEILSKMV